MTLRQERLSQAYNWFPLKVARTQITGSDDPFLGSLDVDLKLLHNEIAVVALVTMQMALAGGTGGLADMHHELHTDRSRTTLEIEEDASSDGVYIPTSCFADHFGAYKHDDDTTNGVGSADAQSIVQYNFTALPIIERPLLIEGGYRHVAEETADSVVYRTMVHYQVFPQRILTQGRRV